jgi:hypothetical protein
MSTFEVLALTSAILVSTVLGVFYIQTKATAIALGIRTGVVEGQALSIKARRSWLWLVFAPYQTASVFLPATLVFVLIRAGQNAASLETAEVAFFCSYAMAVVAVGQALIHITAVLGLSKRLREEEERLRQAEAD